MNQTCKVCGEPAAGFHFGAFTCEGCKSFFGRTYNNTGSISECKNNGECIINKKNRTSCKACRLRKCIRVGMSKSGSRYGRRSNWFKIHCLLQEQSNSPGNPGQLSGTGPGASIFGGAAGLYPGAFFPSHLLTPEKLLASSHINGYNGTQREKRKIDETQQGTSSDDSAASSAGDLEDDSSRSTSALSFLRPPSSPFSDKDYFISNSQRRLNIPSSPVSGSSTSSPFSSPASAHLFSQRPMSTPPFGRLLGFPVTRPGLTPVNGKPLYVDHTLPMRSGGDLLLCSPALAGVAVEQEQPIDLSVKSCSSRCPASPVDRSSEDERFQTGHQDQDEAARTCKEGVTPLDLTNKRPAEVPQSG